MTAGAPLKPPAVALTGLEALWQDLLRNPRFRLALAESAHTPTPLLEWLAEDPEMEVRLAVARNPATPTQALVALTSSWAGRLAVACNHCAPSALLQVLAFDGDLDIRQALAANPNTPAPVLLRLSLDPELSVRRKVALNPSTPPHLLWQLTTQANPGLYLALLRHPNTPGEALEMIVRADPDRLEAARRHPNFYTLEQPRLYRAAAMLNLDCPVCLGMRDHFYASGHTG